MKDFKTTEQKVKYLQEKYNKLTKEDLTATIIAYTIEFTNFNEQEINIFAKVLKDIPSVNTLSRSLRKVRLENPELDNCNNRYNNQQKIKKVLGY